MSLQLSVSCRNAYLDAIETTISTSPILKIFDGTLPANCAAADAGTVVATMTLPSDWLNAASSGTKTLKGTWSDSSADNTGTAQYFRIYDSGGSTCHAQGTVTGSGGGGDVVLDNVSVVAGQAVSVTAFTLTAANS